MNCEINVNLYKFITEDTDNISELLSTDINYIILLQQKDLNNNNSLGMIQNNDDSIIISNNNDNENDSNNNIGISSSRRISSNWISNSMLREALNMHEKLRRCYKSL